MFPIFDANPFAFIVLLISLHPSRIERRISLFLEVIKRLYFIFQSHDIFHSRISLLKLITRVSRTPTYLRAATRLRRGNDQGLGFTAKLPLATGSGVCRSLAEPRKRTFAVDIYLSCVHRTPLQAPSQGNNNK